MRHNEKEERVEKTRTADNTNGGLKDTLRDSTQVKDKPLLQQKQSLADPTSKKQPKPSGVPPPPSLKQKSPAAVPRANTSATRVQQEQQQQSPSATKSHPIDRCDGAEEEEEEESVSEEMAAERRRFLSEMFKDVPAPEIDRVIRSVHWDVNEAATVLSQEDYTWQSVRRRRNGSSR